MNIKELAFQLVFDKASNEALDALASFWLAFGDLESIVGPIITVQVPWVRVPKCSTEGVYMVLPDGS